jgi:hypothetical protein
MHCFVLYVCWQNDILAFFSMSVMISLESVIKINCMYIFNDFHKLIEIEHILGCGKELY